MKPKTAGNYEREKRCINTQNIYRLGWTDDFELTARCSVFGFEPTHTLATSHSHTHATTDSSMLYMLYATILMMTMMIIVISIEQRASSMCEERSQA